MTNFNAPELEGDHFRQIEHEYIGYQSLTDVPILDDHCEETIDIKVLFSPFRKNNVLWSNFTLFIVCRVLM